MTDEYPDISVKKLVSPTADGRTAYAKQLLQSGQFLDVMIAVSPAGFAEAGNLYAWSPDELKSFQFPTANLIKGKYYYQLPANTQTIPPIYYNKKMFAAAGIASTRYALYSLATILSWQMLGFCVVVYLAGLQGVPTELLEAAAIDGAGPVRRFSTATWPLLAPALTINRVMLLISAFKVYDYVKVITNGGPGSGTIATIAFNVLTTGFDANHIGYASAMAILMLVIVAIATAITLRVLQAREVDL